MAREVLMDDNVRRIIAGGPVELRFPRWEQCLVVICTAGVWWRVGQAFWQRSPISSAGWRSPMSHAMAVAVMLLIAIGPLILLYMETLRIQISRDGMVVSRWFGLVRRAYPLSEVKLVKSEKGWITLR